MAQIRRLQIPSYHALKPSLPCAIRCPRCKNEAILDEPFVCLRGLEAQQAATSSQIHGVKFSGGFMVVKYPHEFPWNASENRRQLTPLFASGRPQETWGVCTCGSCGHRSKHLLRWPKDAFYATEVRGQTLWAWDRAQAQALRAYISSSDRKFTGIARPHFWFLRHVPKHFLEVKHRVEAIKKLDRLLARS